MRSSGILLHISSLPSPYGIGTFGKAAYEFVDFLKNAGQVYWQILPLGPTGYGNSPYQSYSAFAGNPYFIDLDMLCDEGLLTTDECSAIRWVRKARRVDYDALCEHRLPVLRLAYARFGADSGYSVFCKKEAYWLDGYALFMAIKQTQSGASWDEWEAGLKNRKKRVLADFCRENITEIEFWRFLQYQFHKQWARLKGYANQCGIKIFGDLPIYVSYDSADVWENTQLFVLDKNLKPTLVAGCPPDAYTETGQLWGNPVYNWGEVKKGGYRWWITRMKKQAELCDAVRLDHFRGYESFYAIPSKDKTAENGSWITGPGIELFKQLDKQVRGMEIIAENLGVLTPEVYALHEAAGYHGMRLLHFGFDAQKPDSEHLPHNIEANNVVYTGTHDNMTTKQWFWSLSRKDRKYCLRYMGCVTGYDFVWRFIRLALSARAKLAVIAMQDYLILGAKARMNCPGTVRNNWQWRAKRSDFTPKLAEKINSTVSQFGRGRNDK